MGSALLVHRRRTAQARRVDRRARVANPLLGLDLNVNFRHENREGTLVTTSYLRMPPIRP